MNENKKISQLEIATESKNTDIIPIVQDGSNKQMSKEMLLGDHYNKKEVDTKIEEVDAKFKNKADKATTLEGYGITDAYDKNAVDEKEANINNTINAKLAYAHHPLTYSTSIKKSDYPDFINVLEKVINDAHKTNGLGLIYLSSEKPEHNGIYMWKNLNFTNTTHSLIKIGNYNNETALSQSYYNHSISCYGSVENDYYTIDNARLYESVRNKVLSTNNSTAYTPTGDYNPATKQYVDNKFAEAIDAGFKVEVVDELPTENISYQMIYLVPSAEAKENNIYEEYVYSSANKWEMIGSTKADLSEYYKKTEVDAKLDEKASKNIVVNDEADATDDTRLIIDTDELGNLGSEVVNSLKGNEASKAPSVAAVNQGFLDVAMKILSEETNIDTIKTSGVFGIYNAKGTLPKGYSLTDNNIFIHCYMWFTAWGRQILHDIRSNRSYVRNLNNDTWGPWEPLTKDYYSTKEQVVGVLEDGTLVYKRTFTGNLDSDDATIVTGALNSTNCRIMKCYGNIGNDVNGMAIGGYVNASWFNGVWLNNQCLYIYASTSLYGMPYYLTIEYTKK